MTLALKKLQEKNLNANQTQTVLNMLNDYEMRNKLKYLIMNNVDINDTLIEYIVNALYEEEVFYNAKYRRLRCNEHVINLAI